MKRAALGIALAAAWAFAAFPGRAQVQDFPVRPVTLIVPWPAGGTTDIGNAISGSRL